MRVLHWPQLSMRSYKDNAWIIGSDSQVTKMLAWMRFLPQDWRWTWIVPSEMQGRGWNIEGAELIEIPWAPNVLLDRHFADPRLWHKLDEAGRFDVAFVEAIEHVAPLRQALKFIDKDVPIIGMIGLYDDRDDAFYYRQLEGYLEADHVIFPVEAVKAGWQRRLLQMVLGNEITQKPHSVVPAIFATDEVNAAKPVRLRNDVPVINFISRLSDNDRTRYLDFFSAIRMLGGRGYSFDVWVANPNEAQEACWILDQSKFVSMASYAWRGRAEYLKRLWQSDIVPVLYPQDEGYSVSFLEAVTAENLMVTADTVVRDGTCGLRFNPRGRVEAIADVLAVAIETVKRPKELQRHIAPQLGWALGRSVERNIEKVKAIVEEVT